MADAAGEGGEPRGVRLEDCEARLLVEAGGAAVPVARTAVAWAVLRAGVVAAPSLTAPDLRCEKPSLFRFHGNPRDQDALGV